MPYKIVFTESYTRRAARFLKKHPNLFGVYEKTLQLLELNPSPFARCSADGSGSRPYRNSSPVRR
jgi:hypothetical protein